MAVIWTEIVKFAHLIYFCAIMVIKTREKLIEVARQLFAHKGIENTTMSDIANASEKGRRTIYTYFKNKREIYNAVIEKESEQLVARLRSVITSDMSPVEKLRRFIDLRIDVVVEAVAHHHDNTVLRALLMRDVKRMERIRQLAIEKELDMLRSIIREGLKTGDFDPEKVDGVYASMIMLFQGIELSYMRNNFHQINVDPSRMREHVKQYIFNAIKKL